MNWLDCGRFDIDPDFPTLKFSQINSRNGSPLPIAPQKLTAKAPESHDGWKTNSPFLLGFGNFEKGLSPLIRFGGCTWRIIPISKWVVT